MGRSNVSSSIFAGLSSPNNRNTQTRLPRRNLSHTMTPRAAPLPLASPYPPSHLPRPPTFPFLPHPSPPSPCLPHSHTHSIGCRLRFRTPAPCARISRISCLLVRKFGPCWSPTKQIAAKFVAAENTRKATSNFADDGGGRSPDNANNIVSTSQQLIQKPAPTCTSLRKGQ